MSKGLPGTGAVLSVHGGVVDVRFREFIFASVYGACTGSMAGENLSRLAAMERAERKIDELTVRLAGDRNRSTQEAVSRELMDLITAVESVTPG